MDGGGTSTPLVVGYLLTDMSLGGAYTSLLLELLVFGLLAVCCCCGCCMSGVVLCLLLRVEGMAAG